MHEEELTGSPDYEALARVTASAEHAADVVHAALLETAASANNKQQGKTLRGVLEGFGVDASVLTEAEVQALVDAGDDVGQEYLQAGLPLLIGKAVSQALGVEWTCNHHTATDIKLYAAGNEGLLWPVHAGGGQEARAACMVLGSAPHQSCPCLLPETCCCPSERYGLFAFWCCLPRSGDYRQQRARSQGHRGSGRRPGEGVPVHAQREPWGLQPGMRRD